MLEKNSYGCQIRNYYRMKKPHFDFCGTKEFYLSGFPIVETRAKKINIRFNSITATGDSSSKISDFRLSNYFTSTSLIKHSCSNRSYIHPRCRRRHLFKGVRPYDFQSPFIQNSL